MTSVSGPLNNRCPSSTSRTRNTYPAASNAGTYAASSPESGTPSTTSTIGFATNPGTDVDPTCSTTTATGPNAARIRSSSRRNSSGHAGSYSTSVIVEFSFGGSATNARANRSSMLSTMIRP